MQQQSDQLTNENASFCVDIGAPKSVIGLPKLNCLYKNSIPRLKKSMARFRFGDEVKESLGTIVLMLQTPPGIQSITVTSDVVDVDIPALHGLDVLDKHQLLPDITTNRLVKRTFFLGENKAPSYVVDDWYVPMTRIDNHVYVKMQMPLKVLYTPAQLEKIHRNFFLPSADKLISLIRRAKPDEATPGTLRILKDISSRCDPCQRIQEEPRRFRVSFGAERTIFNGRILLDVMYIENLPVLHIIDELTRFSAARFLPGISTKQIWDTFVECWCLIYTGIPNKILVDQGSSFGEAFVVSGRLCNVNVSHTGIESHNSLGIGERYHQPLRTTYRKISIAHPHIPKELRLAISVKAMNDTLGPEGLVPLALLFGEFPQIRAPGIGLLPRPNLAERANAAETARAEMSSIMAKMCLHRALAHDPPGAALRTYKPGDNVLVWREKLLANRIGEWVGPSVIESVDEERKLATIELPNGTNFPFNFIQLKPYLRPAQELQQFFAKLRDCLDKFTTTPAVEADSTPIFSTEVLSSNDPRSKGPRMTDEVKTEVKELIDRKTFKTILKEDIPEDANVLPGRFVLSIKSAQDGSQRYKARFVIGGNRDKLKRLMVHSSQTLQPSSIRLTLTLALIHNFDIWTLDVR